MSYESSDGDVHGQNRSFMIMPHLFWGHILHTLKNRFCIFFIHLGSRSASTTFIDTNLSHFCLLLKLQITKTAKEKDSQAAHYKQHKWQTHRSQSLHRCFILNWAHFQCKMHQGFSWEVDEVRDHYLLKIFFWGLKFSDLKAIKPIFHYGSLKWWLQVTE